MKKLAYLRIFLKDNRGGSLVEFVLVVPILLLFLAGAIDFGRAYYAGLEVATAAHAGALYGAQNHGDTGGMTTAAKQSAQDLDSTKLTVATPVWGCECGTDGSQYSGSCATVPTCTTDTVYVVTVSTSYDYNTLTQWPFIPKVITLSKSDTQRGVYP